MPCPVPLSQIAVLKVDNETMHRRFVSLGTEEERIYVLEMEQCVTVMEQEVNTARSLIMIPSHTFACTFLRRIAWRGHTSSGPLVSGVRNHLLRIRAIVAKAF
jgi:hypothetical protein